MAKKRPASSQPAGLESMNSADIANRQWSEKEREVVRRAARKQRAGDDSGINFDDIPRLTGKQLASMVRLRRRAKLDLRARYCLAAFWNIGQ